MKKVREHIDEKFTPESDPVLDMGIGVIRELIKNLWKIQHTETIGNISFRNHQDTYYLHISYYDNKDGVVQKVKDLIGKDKFKNMGAIKTSFGAYQFTGIIKPEYVELFKRAFTPDGYIKKLNEKFEETTDPIEDLGVGNKKKFEDAFKEFVRNAMKGFWSSISKVETIKDSIIFNISHDPYNDNFSNNRYHAMIVSGLDKYVKRVVHHRRSQFTDEYMFEFKPEYQYLIEGIKSIQYKKTFLKGRFIKNQQMYTYEAEIIWKDVNEKFTRESDPIRDMEIGPEKAWKKIKEGTVLKVVNWVNSTHPDDSLIKIVRITNRSDDQISFNYENFYNEVDFLKRDKRGGIEGAWVITFDFFKNNLELVDYLTEKFTAESDPIKDMKIGVDEIVKQLKRDLEKSQGYGFGIGNDFWYYSKEGFIRITTRNLSEIGIVRLQKDLTKFLSKYPGVFKITRQPKYEARGRYGLNRNRDAIIRIVNK